ncbi:MAG: hypothetical protein WCG46_08415 [Methylophilaceae bacterium]|jgi:hypothetical protein
MKFSLKSSLKNGLAVTALALLLPACVTINIYFPAAAAEKAADKLIDDIWQLKNSEKANSGEPAPDNPAK